MYWKQEWYGGRPSYVKGEFKVDAPRPRFSDDAGLVNLQKEIRAKLANNPEVSK